MWSAQVRHDCIGIEVLVGGIAILKINWLCPLQKVFRGTCHDRSHAVHKIPVVGDIERAVRIPERQVLGIKGPCRDHRLVSHQGPVNCIGRLVDVEPLLAQWSPASYRLVPSIGCAIRIGILEGRKAMRADAVPDDIVRFRSFKFEQAKFRFLPVDPVAAFGITGHLPVSRCLAGFIKMGTAIVHPVKVTILEDGVVRRGVSLPGPVCYQHHLLSDRSMESLNCPTGQFFDQVVINQQLKPGPDFSR